MTTKMTTTKAQNYECCMCGDLGLSLELFRCNVCRFRSQHRYCSNLYPKAETYKVCNWCLIQKNDNHTNTTTTATTIISNNSSDTSSPTNKHNKSYNNITNNKMYDHLGGPRAGPGPKGLQPTSPIKKPMIRSMEAQTPSGRKRITAVDFAIKDDRLRRTKSSQDMTKNNNNSKININNNNNSNLSSNSRSNGQGVIKHVFRNKVRRYKLLDEVSS